MVTHECGWDNDDGEDELAHLEDQVDPAGAEAGNVVAHSLFRKWHALLFYYQVSLLITK